MKELSKVRIEALAKRWVEKEDIDTYKHKVITRMNEQNLNGIKLVSYFAVDDWADRLETYCEKYGDVENKIMAECAGYFKKKWEAKKYHVTIIREEGDIVMGIAFSKKPSKQDLTLVAKLYNFRP